MGIGFTNHQDVSVESYSSGLLIPTLANLSSDALLSYFQNRSHIRYLPLKPGTAKHVVTAELIRRNEFNLNNERHILPDDFDWLVNPSRDPEWLILLHKFYYSRDLAMAYDYSGDEFYARKWVELVKSWIHQVPDGFVNSQVTGRRLQQWLLAYQYFVPGHRCTAVNSDFLLAFLSSIQSQAVFLSENLTPQGNHRTIELYAIFSVAVLFPELQESTGLLAFATHTLLENLREDFLPDGVQKELSTDYHHTVLKNFLRVRELADLNGVIFPPEFDLLIAKALEFSIHAHKPDGFLPAINDGDVNSYLSLLKKAHRYYPNEALLYVASQGQTGKQPEQRSRLFADSGYCLLRSGWSEQPYQDGRYFLFDCGNLGVGSHGHYDLLSFEAAAFGRSLIVDPGRYTYHDDPDADMNWRHAFKGTAAHNSVMVDGKDQLAYRCGCPIGPEPRASVLAFVSMPGFDFVNGLATSPEYPVTHQRGVLFVEQEYWMVTDLLTSSDSATHHYDQFFHLAPDALQQTYLIQAHHERGIHSPNLLIVQPSSNGIDVNIEQGWYSPEYGIKQPAPVIRFSQQCQGTGSFQTVLYPFKSIPPKLCVTQLVVTRDGRVISQHEAVAMSILIQIGDVSSQDIVFLAHDDSQELHSFSDITCRAKLLFLRRDALGEILSLQGVGLQRLIVNTRRLIEIDSDEINLSYANGICRVAAANQQKEFELLSPYLLNDYLTTASII